MDTIKCNNCGHDNNTNDRCEVCGEELRPVGNFLNVDYSQDKSKEINLDGKKTNFGFYIFLLFINFPFIFCALAFIAIASNTIITDNQKSVNYLETEAKLVGYDNCDDTCEAIYEYEVDGVTYEASPIMSANRDFFKKTTTVKYDPNKPSEYVMDYGVIIFVFVGIGVLLFVFVEFIAVKLATKKWSKSNVENVKA